MLTQAVIQAINNSYVDLSQMYSLLTDNSAEEYQIMDLKMQSITALFSIKRMNGNLLGRSESVVKAPCQLFYRFVNLVPNYSPSKFSGAT